MAQPKAFDAYWERPFGLAGPEQFNALALDLFQLHAQQNQVYSAFLEMLKVDPNEMTLWTRIPHLPISAFKQLVLLNDLKAEAVFTSSGTTSNTRSSHHMPSLEVYERSFLTSFQKHYGPVKDWRILALLPSYLERGGSSLVYMAERMIELSEDAMSGTYLDRFNDLAKVLALSVKEERRTLLLGVSFALLDLAEQYPMDLKRVMVMETGGMKGRRKEMVRDDLHRQLKHAFNVPHIHSEYGMTELTSQAWSQDGGKFCCPPWMRVSIRDINDPFASLPVGRTGGINIIDLANVGTCPFIATQDLGKMHEDGSFEVLGRFDHSDVRGCNLMV